MRAGPLDRRIVIERVTTTPDEFNAPVEHWSTLATVAASAVASKSGARDGERMTAGAVNAEITTRFQIRYSSTVADVGPRDRIQYNGRTYDIVAVREMGRRDGLEITAAARAD